MIAAFLILYEVCFLFSSLCSVPGVTIATDIICGFPTETAEVGPLFECVLNEGRHV